MKTKNISQWITVLIVIMLNMASMAQPGTLDPTFNTTGYVVKNAGDTLNVPWAVRATPGGKILVAGSLYDTSQHPNVQNLMVLRYNTDGSPDLSFGVRGMAGSNFNSYAQDLTLQPDGKILLAGASRTGAQAKDNLTVFRMNTDGSFDNSFGLGGMVQDTLGNFSTAVAVLADGSILVAGAGYTTGSPKYAFYRLVKYSTNGTPDMNFGNSGFVTMQIPNCTGAYILGMVVQTDGKILLGDEIKLGRYCMAMTRFNANGSLDAGFGVNGIVIDSAGLRNGCYKLAVQSDGKILVPAYVYTTDLLHPHYSLFRYNSNGSRDSTFHGNGCYIGEEGAAYDIAIQKDGKILSCGNYKNDSTAKRGVVARYLPSGDPDPLFGINGVAAIAAEMPSGFTSISVCPDGKVITTGYCHETVTPRFWRTSITVRLNSFGLGLDKRADEVSVKISPNPFREKIIVEAANLKGSEITVNSMDGRVLAGFRPGSDRETIHLGFLSPGMYILRLNSGSSSRAIRIIKL